MAAACDNAEDGKTKNVPLRHSCREVHPTRVVYGAFRPDFRRGWPLQKAVLEGMHPTDDANLPQFTPQVSHRASLSKLRRAGIKGALDNARKTVALLEGLAGVDG